MIEEGDISTISSKIRNVLLVEGLKYNEVLANFVMQNRVTFESNMCSC